MPWGGCVAQVWAIDLAPKRVPYFQSGSGVLFPLFVIMALNEVENNLRYQKKGQWNPIVLSANGKGTETDVVMVRCHCSKRDADMQCNPSRSSFNIVVFTPSLHIPTHRIQPLRISDLIQSRSAKLAGFMHPLPGSKRNRWVGDVSEVSRLSDSLVLDNPF